MRGFAPVLTLNLQNKVAEKVCNSGYFIQIKNLYVFIAYDNDDIDEKTFYDF